MDNYATLNRYSYANGNPVSNVDPFGLSAERGGSEEKKNNSNNISELINLLSKKTDYSNNQDFFKYNLLINNCLDYVKAILKKADTKAELNRNFLTILYV